MPNRVPVIALDAMGGDYGPEVTVPAALDCLKEFPRLRLILVGQQEAIEAQLARHASPHEEQLALLSLS
ncbi:MAG: hypothetical protein ACK4JF_05145, partial [Methylohalobius sp.]